jgi:hypothetical protein
VERFFHPLNGTVRHHGICCQYQADRDPRYLSRSHPPDTFHYLNKNKEKVMLNVLRDEQYVPAFEPTPQRSAVWRSRLLTVAIVLILWATSVLILQLAGPDARAFLAGEGILIADPR